MAEYLIQEATLTGIGDAIRKKRGTTGKIAPGKMPEEIEAIQTGSDTSDATIEAEDIVAGKIGYGKNGTKITGTMRQLTQAALPTEPVENGNYFEFAAENQNENAGYIPSGGTFAAIMQRPMLGACVDSDVLAGNTYSSAEGVCRTGTYVPLDTSDATAAAGDICKGKTAYVNGAKVTGTVAETKSGSNAAINNPQQGTDGSVVRSSPFRIVIQGPNSTDRLIRAGATVNVAAPAASFGDAAAADVAKGKTFTSQNGVKITGTMEAIALDSIAAALSQTEYVPGDPFDDETLTVTAYYTNGASKLLDGSVYSITARPDTSTAGTKTGTVSYTEGGVTKTVSFTVTVQENVEDDTITYTGNMTDQIVTMSGVAYRLLILTSSGTLSFANERKGDVWVVGGGATAKLYGDKGRGGAGAYVYQANQQTLSGSMAVNVAAADGSSGIVNGPAALAIDGSVTYSGGTGGGATNATSGTGDGKSKYPFGDTSGAKLRSTGTVVSGTDKPHCGGGGGGGYLDNEEGSEVDGGNGGTNGSNGGNAVSGSANGGTGGSYGGGNGGAGSRDTDGDGSAATFYGSGGGSGGTHYTSSGKSTFGSMGAGYQGVVYIRIPLDQSIYN